MNTQLKFKVFFFISFFLLFIQAINETYASHAQSADITYQCLGGNQYRINLSFYRDCAGVPAPNTATVNLSSVSCVQNLNITLNQIPGTGIEVSPICALLNSQCTGGAYPGVQEYKYTGIVTLPTNCSDWIFSFSLCCRNASIGTILAPASENIYVEAHLNNLNFPCNSSPIFSNAPVPFVCIGQPYCFNNGSSDPDGDSLSYTLIIPATSPTTFVTYIAPYTATQPLSSIPAVTFNNVTGDMCMTPTALEVTVFAVLVQEWRAEVLVGSVMRDIQLRTITCTNNNPYVNGINNGGIYSLTACAGVPINFSITSFDVDTAQNVSIIWNSGIAGATFTSSGGTRPIGTFSWTPTSADISSTSHCFTITVQDDNCPYNGSQTYSFCITITGIILNTTSTDANCGALNGTTLVQVISGAGPFTYQWLGGGTNANQNGLSAGTYTVNVTGAGGCMSSATATINNGAAPGNVNMNGINISCYGSNSGSATANASGGAPPYTYLWNTGATTSTITGLALGVYYVMVTTSNGCIKYDTITITQPAAPLTYTTLQSNVTCNGLADGLATAVPSGGTFPYTYVWNTIPIQTTSVATSLSGGIYSVIITDDNGCSISTSVTIFEPTPLNANAMVVSNVSCYGFSDGFATVGASGGTGTYNYMWNTSPPQYIQSVNGLATGNYIVTVSDANSCLTFSSITITQPPILSLSSAAFPVTCNGANNGQTIVIPAGGSPTYTYQWMPTGGTGPSATGLSPGTYNITITDANSCVISASMVVTQPSALIVSSVGSATICSGQNTLISAAATGGTGAYTFNWTGLGAGANQNVSPSTTTIYNVTATDANGCSSNLSSVTINVTSLTAANLTASGSSAICYGNSATISCFVSGGTGPVTLNWSAGLGTGNGPFTVSPINSITYIVTVTDACGTSVNANIPITVNPLPVIDIAPQSANACTEVILSFFDNSTTNAGATYNWYFGDGSTSAQVSPVHNYTSSGNYNVNLIVTSVAGCSNNANVLCSVVVYPGSNAAFLSEGLDGTTISPVYKFTNTSTNSVSCLWNFGDGSSSTVVNPNHTYASKSEYMVILYTISINGCKDSVMEMVEIKAEFTLYIPNAFTPDGNGNNDYFTAKGDEISEFKMMIFDRWGELIFETDDIYKGWDGKANHGDEVSENGVYVYKISVRDFEQKYHGYTGHVTLLASQ